MHLDAQAAPVGACMALVAAQAMPADSGTAVGTDSLAVVDEAAAAEQIRKAPIDPGTCACLTPLPRFPPQEALST